MPVLDLNGTEITYSEHGVGETVLMAMGTGSPGHVWQAHQVPALVAAGYRVVTFDNRGLAPHVRGAPPPLIEDIVTDVVGLIQRLCGGQCRLVGVSMGAHVVQEVLVAHPGLATQAVLMATRGQPDVTRATLAEAEAEMMAAEIQPPAKYLAIMRALQSLSPHTLNDDTSARYWLEMLEMFAPAADVVRAQAQLEVITYRLDAYRGVRTPCMVIAFEDDLITPPHLGRQVADSIPGCRYEIVSRCGHLGYLERPDAVNALLLDFFG